jgi:hypothetical protein
LVSRYKVIGIHTEQLEQGKRVLVAGTAISLIVIIELDRGRLATLTWNNIRQNTHIQTRDTLIEVSKIR